MRWLEVYRPTGAEDDMRVLKMRQHHAAELLKSVQPSERVHVLAHPFSSRAMDAVMRR